MAILSERFPRRRLLRVVVMLAALASLAATACASAGYTYVTSTNGVAFFRIPDDWTLFDQDDFLERQGGEISPQAAEASRAGQWLVGFDADPNPALEHLLSVDSRYPTGFAKHRALTEEEHDTFSLATLRNSVFEVDQGAEQGAVEILAVEDLVLEDDGYRGSRVVFNLRGEEGYVTINQTGLVDLATQNMYLFLVGCEANCYLQHQEDIDRTVESWTLKEPR